jgi:uncharacterized iron-regulated membrane protein
MNKIIRKIHLWLAIPLGIIIAVICLSGAILVFETEITELAHHDRYFAKEVKEEPIPLSELIAKVNSQLENNSVTSAQIPSDPKRNYSMGLSEGFRTSAYVDPYTGELIEIAKFGDGFFGKIRQLHRWLLDETRNVGKPVVGYTTLFFVFILITGIIIWLPKTRNQLKQRLRVETKSGLKRFWRNMHTTVGMYAFIGLLVLSLTGLTYSFRWYNTGFYKLLGVEVSEQGRGEHGGGNQNPNRGSNNHLATQEENASAKERRAGTIEERGGEHDRRNNPEKATNSEKRNKEADKQEIVSDSSERSDAATYRNRHEHRDRPYPGNKQGQESSSNRSNRAEHDTAVQGNSSPEIAVATADAETPYSNRHEHGDKPYYGEGHENRPDQSKKVESGTTVVKSALSENAATTTDTETSRKNRPEQGNSSSRRDRPERGHNPVFSNDTIQRGNHSEHNAFSESEGLNITQWATVLTEMKEKNPNFRTIAIQNGSVTVSQKFTFGNARASDRYTFDAATGKIIESQLYENQPRGSKIRGWIFTLHVGSWGGLFSKILMFIVALIGASLPLTGYYIFFIKRKKKTGKTAD